jgi:hypothetical protein
MAQPGTTPRTATAPRTATTLPTTTTAQTTATGLRSWTRERKIYLAVGILASLAGVLIIAFSR